jgi:pilus assembly protein FimV
MRAKPFITGGLLAGVLTLSVPALALGLGRLTVNSGLGQPLSAQIELTAAQKDDLDSLKARIADPSVYRDNGAQYVGALARARITVEQGANASYLRVTTAAPVNEPFLNLIIELSWATGRVVRDYTFLLDPPGTTEMQAIEPAAPTRPEVAPTRATRAGRRAAEAAASAASTSTVPDTPGSYTVKRGDTLSKIANEYKPANVSLEQMLVALFRSNEAAFDAKNMNRLRSGQIITVPQRDQMAPVTHSEAVNVVKVQAADWRAYRDRVAAAAPASDTTAARRSGGGTIGTTVEDQAATALGSRDRVSVSREPGKATAAASADDVAAKDKALREANSHVADLEKTVRDLQRAAALKSQTMSDLQAKAEPGKGTPVEVPRASDTQIAAVTPPSATTPPAATTTAVPPPGTTTAAPPAGTTTAVPPPGTATAVPPPGTATATPPSGTTTATPPPGTTTVVPPVVIPPPDAKASDTIPLESKAPEAKAATPPPEQKTAFPKSAVPPRKAPEPSFIDDLFGNTPTWAVGLGALIVLGGIAAIIAARRRKTTKFEDSIISGTDIKTNTVFGSTGGGVVNTGDNSLASDFSRQGLGNIDTDEVDPIAEAEVYLAYGRDAQAEEILKDALKKDSQRQEIYLKLLEIHAQHNKPSAFETVASELYAVSGGHGEVWQKAMALGRQLDPTNPLFAEAGGGAAFATATTAAAAHAARDTQVFSVPPDLKPEPRGGTPLDFTFDDDISVSPTSGAAEAKTPAAILGGAAEQVARPPRSASEPPKINFERPAVSAATLAATAAVAAAAAVAARTAAEKSPATVRDTVSFDPESIPKFDLDFHLDEPAKPAPSAPKAAPAILSATATATARPPAMATAGAPAPQLTRPAAAIELDKLDLAFDPKRSTFEDPTPSVLDGQWHDAATKLDLAKAYQEMGDVEGAREILQEVLHEGDDQQKAEAQALITKLA